MMSLRPPGLRAALVLCSWPALAQAQGGLAPGGGDRDGTEAVQTEAYGELVKRAAAGLGPGEAVTHADLTARPADFRGRTIRWAGVILGDVMPRRIEPVPLAAGEAPPDVSRACEAVLLDPVSGTTWAATFLAPGPRPAAHGRIELEGAFWKIVTWRNRRGATVAAPYLVAKTWALEPVEEPATVLPLLMALTGGLAIASIVVGAQAHRRKDEWASLTASAR
jgi:hypothetical protein